MAYDPILERQNKALAEQRRERLERESKEAEAEAERKSRNDAARGRYLAKLDAEQDALRAAAEARLEEAIAPDRLRLMRDWLANHAGKSEKDFMDVAWPHHRLNFIEERDRRQLEATKAALRSTGKYAF
jgi:multidrug efflux pump subunit AcrA (membrane-fusion protein)